MNLPDWMKQAACARDDVDPEWFFPETWSDTRNAAFYKLAKEVCASCPVIDDCLAYAKTEQMAFGVWGGKTPRERSSRRQPIAHGTTTGYKAHRRRGEEACAACKQANTEHCRQKKGARLLKCVALGNHGIACNQWALRDGDLCRIHAKRPHQAPRIEESAERHGASEADKDSL